MIKSAIILFLSAFLGGILAINSVDFINKNIKNLLVFAGSFLFSITVLHILPELFSHEEDKFNMGLAILGGFIFQYILENFTNGVEHGHVHVHHREDGHSVTKAFSLMVALSVHAFLEGTLLAHPESLHASHTEGSLLAGIVLHKIPAALALISVLACQFKSRKTQIILLTIFALASPLGQFAGHFLEESGILGHESMIILFAFVAGNFMHISTTIFLESSPEHKLNFKKLAIILLGVSIAALTELYIQ